MALVGLLIGEGVFCELELQASFALCRSAGGLFSQNFQEESLQARRAGKNLNLPFPSGLEMFFLGLPIRIVEGHSAIKGLEAIDCHLQHGIPVPGSGFHHDAGTGIMPEVVSEVLDQNRLALSLHDDERGVSRSAWFAFCGIRAGHG